MKRILSIDGGGIHGVFALQILKRIEAILAARQPDPSRFRLADYFELIAGTSSGGITAAMLAWGASVAEVEAFYLRDARTIFKPSSWRLRWLYHRFGSDGLTTLLQNYFRESSGEPAQLGSARLRTRLLLVLRNASTGSPWVVTNHSASTYNRRLPGLTNLEIPLWQLVRASTAAPTFFPAQKISVGATAGRREFEFIDGGASPYNNPAYLAYLTATLPEYGLNFPKGADRLFLASVGVGRRTMKFEAGEIQDLSVLGNVKMVIASLLDSASMQQDLLCRTTGLCVHGAELDREVKTLIPTAADLPEAAAARAFRYVRYNHQYSAEEMAMALRQVGGTWDLANLELIPTVIAAGKNYAETQVRAEHLP